MPVCLVPKEWAERGGVVTTSNNGAASLARGRKGKRSTHSRDSPRSSTAGMYSGACTRQLNAAGVSRLRSALSESFQIHPRQPNYPVLHVVPEELIRFLLSRIAMATGERDAMVEVHGGVASSVVDVSELASSPLLHRKPTDFDARFILTHDGVPFEYCRNMLEEFLFLKLSSAIGELYNGPPLRYVYFTKHAIIANTLSVMSIGNPETGKNIDVEFVHTRSRPRVYFDDANSAIIPITLVSLGSSKFTAATLCGDFDRMIALRRWRLLQVPRWNEITNGLPLYIHATLDKGFSAPTREDGMLCSHFCQSFVAECQRSAMCGRDPTSLLQSFMRSHYPMQPTACLAMVVSVVVNLLLHCQEADIAALRPNLSDLMCRYLAAVADVLDDASDEDACAEIVSTLLICHYLARPTMGAAMAGLLGMGKDDTNCINNNNTTYSSVTTASAAAVAGQENSSNSTNTATTTNHTKGTRTDSERTTTSNSSISTNSGVTYAKVASGATNSNSNSNSNSSRQQRQQPASADEDTTTTTAAAAAATTRKRTAADSPITIATTTSEGEANTNNTVCNSLSSPSSSSSTSTSTAATNSSVSSSSISSSSIGGGSDLLTSAANALSAVLTRSISACSTASSSSASASASTSASACASSTPTPPSPPLPATTPAAANKSPSKSASKAAAAVLSAAAADHMMEDKEAGAQSRLFTLPATSIRRTLYLQKRTMPPQSVEMAALLVSDVATTSQRWSGAVKSVPAKLRCLLVAVAAVLACDRSDPQDVTSFALLELTRALVNEDLAGDAYSWVFEGTLGTYMTKEDRSGAVSLIDAACSNSSASKRRRKHHSHHHHHHHHHHHQSSVSGMQNGSWNRASLPPPPSSALPRRVSARRSSRWEDGGVGAGGSVFLLGRPAGITSFLLGAMSLHSGRKSRQHGLRC